MGVVGKTRVPPAVRKLTVQAGPAHSFWWSYQTPGQMPEPGSTTGDVTNQITAGALDPSTADSANEPTWNGGRLTCGNDDLLTASYGSSQSASQIIQCAVFSVSAGGSFDAPVDFEDVGSSNPRILIIADDDTSVEFKMVGSNGNSAAANSGATPDMTNLTAVIGAGDSSGLFGGSDNAKLYHTQSGTGTTTATASASFTGSFSVSDLSICGRSADNAHVDGDVRAIGQWLTMADDDFLKDRLLPQLGDYL